MISINLLLISLLLGNLIKKKANTNHDRYLYYIDTQFNLDHSLVQLVEKILPLCQHHDEITIFTLEYSAFEKGLIFQALCDALLTIKRDFVTAVNVLDNEFESENLSLQRLWHEIQKPLKIFESLVKLINDIKQNRHKSPLSVLYQSLITSTDSEIHGLFFFLFQKSIFPFLEMLGKWIYYGLIDDQFGEFMIEEKQYNGGIGGGVAGDVGGMENFDWDDRFHFRTNKVSLGPFLVFFGVIE